MEYFPYGITEVSHLMKVDSKLAFWIDAIGPIRRPVILDPFKALLSSIVSQQISRAAASTIWQRFTDLVGSVGPEEILSASTKDLRACGLSQRKVEYVVGIAVAAKSGEIPFGRLRTMPERELMECLCQLRGVGPWTVEMLRIFSLLHPDVLSWSDLGIQRGLQRLHDLESISKDQFQQYQRLYSPYGSTASLYLWEIAGMEWDEQQTAEGR